MTLSRKLNFLSCEGRRMRWWCVCKYDLVFTTGPGCGILDKDQTETSIKPRQKDLLSHVHALVCAKRCVLSNLCHLCEGNVSLVQRPMITKCKISAKYRQELS